MIIYTLLKIKPGKREVWLDWCREVMEKHYEEAVDTIIEENLIHERCLIFGAGDESFVLYKHQSVEGKEKLPFNPDIELNRIHASKFRECLELISTGTDGYDLKVQL